MSTWSVLILAKSEFLSCSHAQNANEEKPNIDLSDSQLNLSYPLMLKHLTDYSIGFIGKSGALT